MKIGRRILAALLTVSLCICLGTNAYAQEADDKKNEEEELTEAEKKEKEEQKRIYKLPIQTNELKDWPKGPGTYGEAAIVMEVGTGSILYAKNIDDHHYPASITKVLTALVAFENGSFEDQVTFSHDCVSFLQPGDSSVGLKEGNVITLEQALYATLLASANEAAYAVGENVGKNAGHDYQWFIDQMNQRCKELGGENSNFVNTNGLHDPDHYTCARDMALIGRELFSHSEFFEIVQTMEYKIPKSKTVEEHVFQQKHKMLKKGNSNYYKYAIGGKTGFTSDALSTLITMADNGEMQLVCVVLRTHGKNVYPDTTNLFNYAFKNFHKVDVREAEKSEDVGEILEEEGSSTYVMLPKGIGFDALDMELTPDEGIEGTATLTYTYEGHYAGEVKAKLSDSYLEEHSAKIEEVEGNSPDKTAGKSGRSRTETLILAGACACLLILIIAFICLVIRARRKRKIRRRRK